MSLARRFSTNHWYSFCYDVCYELVRIQRYRAVSEHDWGETLSQITKTRAKVPALCAKAALEDLNEDALSRNLVHELSARTALVLF